MRSAPLNQPESVLIRTKLTRPPARAGFVERPRLLDRLDGLLAHRVTLVSAPPGFGKTTLATQWLDGQHSAHSLVQRFQRDDGLFPVIPYPLRQFVHQFSCQLGVIFGRDHRVHATKIAVLIREPMHHGAVENTGPLLYGAAGAPPQTQTHGIVFDTRQQEQSSA